MLWSITFFFFENRAVYEIMWKNMVQPGRTYMTIWRMRIACRIPKAKNTYSEYVILTAFLLQQWLQARSSVLRYMYITVSIFGWKALSVRAAAHSRMYAIKFTFLLKPPFFREGVDENMGHSHVRQKPKLSKNACLENNLSVHH
jgi:hypothetical protein